MTLLPTVFILWNSQIYVHPTNSGDVTSYIEASVNKTFSIATALDISDVQPNNCYVKLQRHFNNARS